MAEAAEWQTLHRAAEERDCSAIRRYLKRGFDVDKYLNGDTALHIACREGHREVVKYLVDAGANMDLLTQFRHESPLYLASAKGYLEIVTFLIERGAQVYGKQGSGNEALYAATRFGCTEVLNFLIQQGINVDSNCPVGHTLVTLASQHGHRKTLRGLLEAGASVNQVNRLGQSPLFVAVLYQHSGVVQELVAAGADANLYNEKFQSYPLHLAVTNGDLSTVNVLLSAGCDVNATQIRSQTPLYVAAELGFPGIVDSLLQAGADPDLCTTDSENTPLFAACERPLLSLYINADKPIINIVRELIQAGCDVDHENKFGQKPLQAALDKQLCDVALMLLHAECSVRADCWLACEMDFYIISLENECSELYSTFIQELKNPRSLKRMCRVVFRRQLSRQHPFCKTIPQLPLPKPLLNYLLYRDI